jgi:hypothetical protein
MKKGLYLKLKNTDDENFVVVKQKLAEYSGDIPVIIYLTDTNKKLEAPRNLWVREENALISSLFDILGEKNLFSVYPNPSNGAVKFTLNFDVKITVQVFDILGKMIYISDNHNGGMDELNVFLSNLDEGIYMIKAFGEKNIFTTKLVKY